MNPKPDNDRRTIDDVTSPSTDGGVAPAETIALTGPNSVPSPPPLVASGREENQSFAATIDLPAGQPSSADPGNQAKSKPRGSAVLHTRVGDYEILNELGRGGMGVVYRARHKQLARDVALKMILVGAHAGEEQVARFMTEAQAVAHLQHQNIVQIFDIGDHDGLPYFSLEFVNGPSLSQKVRGQPQPPAEAARIIEILARAMQYAHDHDVLHRDLKPANILLTEDGVPKISDFGLAKRLEDDSDSGNTRTGTIMGTPSYMSPEQAGGEIAQLGPATDQYSLGAMLYELLTGRPPFLAAKAMETVLQVMREEPVPPRQLQPNSPVDLETICLKALQKDIAKRYANCHELAEDLRRFQAGEPILARPVSAPERFVRWCRRNPRVASLSGTVLFLLVAGVGGLLVANIRIRQEKEQAKLERAAAVVSRDLARQKELEAKNAAEAEKEARGLADKKTDEAREAQKLADQNAKVAGEQRKLALDTLYSVVTKVDGQLSDRDDMQKLRQELIEDAMAGLRRVEESDTTNSLVDRSMGVGHQRMADIFQKMGRSEDALNEHKRALEIFGRLLQTDANDHWARWDAALSCDKLGDLTRVLGSDAAFARAYYAQALKHRETLPADIHLDDLTPTRIKQSLVNSFAKLYSVSLSLGDVVGARDYLRKTLEFSEALVAANPNNPQAKQALSGSNLLLGRLSFRLREVAAASDYYHKSLKLRQELVDADPLSVNYRRLLASTYDALGDLHLQLSSDPAAAVEQYSKAKELYEPLYAKNAKDAESQAGLASSHYRMGTALLLQSKPAEAELEFQPCLKLRQDLVAQDPKNTDKQVQLIHVQAHVGQHAAAFAAAEELRGRAKANPDTLYNLVCGYALCAAAVSNGKSADELSADDRGTVEQYVTVALDTLSQAIALGYNNVTQIDSDPELAAIRASHRFAEIRSGLQP